MPTDRIFFDDVICRHHTHTDFTVLIDPSSSFSVRPRATNRATIVNSYYVDSPTDLQNRRAQDSRASRRTDDELFILINY